MNELTTFHIRDSFPAAHRIRIDTRGTLEPVHVHHWRVDALIAAEPPLEPQAQRALGVVRRWVERHRGRSLNDVPPFDRVNPTAEEVARSLCRELAAGLSGLHVLRVTIGEAAGFSATYHPPDADRADGADPPETAC